MRRIVVSNIVSLDGYYEGPDSGVSELNMDEFFDTHNLECLGAADAVLVGTRSYQGFSAYWPFVETHEDVAPDDPTARAFDETNRSISRCWNTKPIVVVSDSFRVPDDGPWASHTMWNGLLARGLVDELRLMVCPAALGGGEPAFTGPAALRLEETCRCDGSDNVLLVYAAAQGDQRDR